MSYRRLFALSLPVAAAFALTPQLPVLAQASDGDVYVHAKLIKRGKNTTPIAGTGTVVIQVYVKVDGSFKVQKIIKSTNPADNEAATELASTSTYKPATRNGKSVAEFYSFTVKFNGSEIDAGDPQVSGTDLRRILGMVNANNFKDAQPLAKAYVAANPTDQNGQALLGVTDSFLNDYSGAVAAFDAAGKIPDKYKAAALNSYVNFASESYKAKNYDASIAAGKRALSLGVGPGIYNLIGNAELAKGENAQAVADLERAQAGLKADAKTDPKNLINVEVNLISAYSAAGQNDKAQALAKQVLAADPTANVGAVLANNYLAQAQLLARDKKFVEAANLLDTNAKGVPSSAALTMYGVAANYAESGEKPDWKLGKAEADKALAIAPSDARANYYAGIAVASEKSLGTTQDALVYLNKADAAAKAGTDAELTKQIQATIKQLSK